MAASGKNPSLVSCRVPDPFFHTSAKGQDGKIQSSGAAGNGIVMSSPENISSRTETGTLESPIWGIDKTAKPVTILGGRNALLNGDEGILSLVPLLLILLILLMG